MKKIVETAKKNEILIYYKNIIYKCLMPGWLSWLERTAHRVIKQCSDLFLGYREAAGSNPAPGIFNPRNSYF